MESPEFDELLTIRLSKFYGQQMNPKETPLRDSNETVLKPKINLIRVYIVGTNVSFQIPIYFLGEELPPLETPKSSRHKSNSWS